MFVDGIPVTTVERCLVDLGGHLATVDQDKAIREALRVRLATVASLRAAVE